MQQGGKEDSVENHDQREQYARDIPLFFLKKEVKDEIGPGPEQDDQNEEGNRSCNFYKEIDGQNKERLTDERTPAELQEPGNSKVGSGQIPAGAVDENADIV
jgi:hypothetical protein